MGKLVIIHFKVEPGHPLGFRLDPNRPENKRLRVSQVRKRSNPFNAGLKTSDRIVEISNFNGPLVYENVMEFLDNFTGDLCMTVLRSGGRSDLPDSEPVLPVDSKACNHHENDKKESSKPSSQQVPAQTSPKVQQPSSTGIPSPAVAPQDLTNNGRPAWLQEASARVSRYENLQSSPLRTSSTAQESGKAVPPPPPPPKPSTPGSAVLQPSEDSDFRVSQELKHNAEPTYPKAFGGGGDDSGVFSSRAQMVFKPPVNASGETTVQIQVRPSGDESGQRATFVTQKTFKADMRRSELNKPLDQIQDGQDKLAAVLMMPERPQVKEQRKTIPLEHTRDFSAERAQQSTQVEDEETPVVSQISKQWPPPSNATGVEIVKDMWGAPVLAANIGDVVRRPGESEFEPITLSPTGPASSVGEDMLSRPSKLDLEFSHNEQTQHIPGSYHHTVLGQVRACQQIARALKAPIDSSGKSRGARIFAARRDRVARWVANTSPEDSVEIPEPGGSPGPDVYQSDSDDDTYYSARSSEPELPKAIRNPQGVHDYQSTIKQYGREGVTTNMMSPEKSQQLAQFLLHGEAGTGRGVDLFSKQRERAEQYVVDQVPPPQAQPQPVQRDVETSKWASDSSRGSFRATDTVEVQRGFVRPADVVDTVNAAAAERLQRSVTPQPPPSAAQSSLLAIDPSYATAAYAPAPATLSPAGSDHHGVGSVSGHVSRIQQESRVFSPGPPSGRTPSASRLFSPTPWSSTMSYGSSNRTFSPMGRAFSPAHRTFSPTRNYGQPVEMTPTEYGPPKSSTLPRGASQQQSARINYSSNQINYSSNQFGVRGSDAPRGWTPSRGAPEQVTTATLAITTPTTRIVTTSSNQSPGGRMAQSTFNALPRSWKSFSEHYRHE